MRSPRRALIERLRDRGDDTHRYIDCAVQLRVYRRGKGGDAVPCELLPRAFGGVYDRFAAQYIAGRRPEKIHELKIHQGQLPLFAEIGTARRRILALGAPGGGKTKGIAAVAVALSVRRANSLGGVIAPTQQSLGIIRGKILELLEPAGFVAEVSPGRNEIRLVNGTVLQFRGAARKSAATGSPIAGHDWHFAVEDEQNAIDDDALREVDARGRITANYQVFSSATNEALHQFQTRLQKYDANPQYVVHRFSGPDNAFTPLSYWEGLRADWSEEDYERYIRCLDVPKTGRVFPTFSYQLNTAKLPAANLDITGKLTYDKYRVPYQYVIGWDPGVIASASVVMKAYAGQGADERNWFVLGEITTRDATTEHHAADLVRWLLSNGISLDSVLVLGDPHENKDTDRSDYHQMRASGLTVVRSNQGVQIERKHRISMTNALLKDASGRRRLYLAASELGPPRAQKLAECLGQLMYRPNGEIDYEHKTWRNLAHWGDALGYGLFPFEKLRGNYKPRTGTDANMGAGMRRHMGQH
jgi:hypothetical protein